VFLVLIVVSVVKHSWMYKGSKCCVAAVVCLTFEDVVLGSVCVAVFLWNQL